MARLNRHSSLRQTDAKEIRIWKAGKQELKEPDSASFEFLSCFPAFLIPSFFSPKK
jgi:hypothetical protein